MASLSQWVQGARPRTLPAALAPVAAGTGVAVWQLAETTGTVDWSLVVPRALLALAVSFCLQIGVNFANDYSDGIRGTDDDRVGPFRLTGSGAAAPGTVKAAAFGALAAGGVFGLVLIVLAQIWGALLIGAAAIAAAWFYTGGRKPYGYLGLGVGLRVPLLRAGRCERHRLCDHAASALGRTAGLRRDRVARRWRSC